MNSSGIIITHTLATYEPQDPEPAHVVTRGMLRERAVELAISHGRLAHETNKDDWQSAKDHYRVAPRRRPGSQE